MKIIIVEKGKLSNLRIDELESFAIEREMLRSIRGGGGGASCFVEICGTKLCGLEA